jgi:hypothetical protein
MLIYDEIIGNGDGLWIGSPNLDSGWGDAEPCRMVGKFPSLLDMIHFMAWQLGLALVWLEHEHDDAFYHCASMGERDIPIPEDRKSRVAVFLAYIRKKCEAVELDGATKRVQIFQNNCRFGITYQELATEAKVLREAMESDLVFRRFASIPSDRAKLLDKIDADWAQIQERFKVAREDIRSAVECYALDCNTASVFHSMRVAEYGLRDLARRIGIKRIGKQRHPLEFAEWGSILNEIKGKLNALQQTPGRTKQKADRVKFYANAADQINYLNELWRKEVAHAREAYNAPVALDALTRVNNFMTLLLPKQRKSAEAPSKAH